MYGQDSQTDYREHTLNSDFRSKGPKYYSILNWFQQYAYSYL